MSETIILKVQNYLSNLTKGIGERVEYPVLASFASRTTNTFRRTLDPERQDRDFRLRMSNIGRPACILQGEKYKFPRDAIPYNVRMRNAFGDIIESAAVAIMKQAGVNIIKEQEQVQLEIAGKLIDGTLDIIIAEPDAAVYDVKSASSWSFRNKYSGSNLGKLWKDGDDFGYVTQIYLYSEAKKLPAGGLIVINKETGEWGLVQPPVDDEELKKEVLAFATNNVIKLSSDAPFERSFTDQPEYWRRKPTGNRVLGTSCGFCSFRETCWPTAKLLPQPASKGATPRNFWYTKIANETKISES